MKSWPGSATAGKVHPIQDPEINKIKWVNWGQREGWRSSSKLTEASDQVPVIKNYFLASHRTKICQQLFSTLSLSARVTIYSLKNKSIGTVCIIYSVLYV